MRSRPSLPARNIVLLALIAAAHLGLGFAVLQGSRLRVPLAAAPIQVSLLLPHPAAELRSVARPSALHVDLPAVPRPEVDIPVETAPVTMAAAPAGPPPLSAPHLTGETQPAASPTPLSVSDIAYLRQPSPRYPSVSRHAREEGLVVVQVTIDETGRVRDVLVFRSSGHPRLDQAAKEAVALALFKPYVSGGIARAAMAMIPIEFSLRGTAS